MNFRTIESNRGNIAKFCITKTTLTPGKNYIRAHTCFNRLDLPEFRNKKDLQEAMDFVAKNEILGFGIDWNSISSYGVILFQFGNLYKFINYLRIIISIMLNL